MILDSNAKEQMAKSLSKLLADTYILYTKTQNFHWNIVDPSFYSHHKMFQEQYEELAEAIDEVAERIRMVGHHSPGSLKQFLEIGSIKESGADLSGPEMIQTLAKDHEAMVASLHSWIANATEARDEGTADMMVGRLRAHEKSAWMLRSHL